MAVLIAITFAVVVSGQPRSSCLKAAERVIASTPDHVEEPHGPMQQTVTTSHLYKRDVAKYFCGNSADMTALELGVYHGHTTALLASMFKKVIAVDVKKHFLKTATETLGPHGSKNVVFLEMDLYADSWSIFSGNRVEVVVIDASHFYEYVRADAENALRYLPHLRRGPRDV
eukprot:Skav214955  [mRNA]  locus=scaffold2320:180583:181444:+ [translate_table: standard]